METVNLNIDKGKAFDWGRVSDDYSKFRDIYPEEFDVLHYAAIAELKKKDG
ncbi:MAG: hypothetical protein ACI4XH_03260 [Acutalibacteraceae bacterium]